MSLINENSTTKEILSEIRYTFMEKEFEEYQGIVVRREEDLKTALKKSKEDYGLLKEEHELLKEELDFLERNHCSSVLEKLELEEELKKIKIEFDSLKKKRFPSESETHYAGQNLKKQKIETDEEAVMELRKENEKLKEEIELYRKKFPEHLNRMACIEEMLADFKEKNDSNFRAENADDAADDDDDHSPDDSISSQNRNSRNSTEIQSSNLRKEGAETMHMGSRENTPSTGLNLQNSASDLGRGINEPLTEAIFTVSAAVTVEVNTAANDRAEPPNIVVLSDSSDIDSSAIDLDDDESITDSFMDEMVRK